MANLKHITQFMPTIWHKDRIIWETMKSSISFEQFLRKRHQYPSIASFQGALGEMQVAAWVHGITETSHAIFNGVLIPNEESVTGDTEIDLIWAGEHGVLVLEVKSYRGVIDVYGNDDWQRSIPGSYGRSSTIKNPVGQCIGQAKKLKKYLKKKGFDIPVRGLLVFPASKEIRVIDKPRIPIVQSQEGLIRFMDSNLPARVSQSTLTNVLLSLSQMERI